MDQGNVGGINYDTLYALRSVALNPVPSLVHGDNHYVSLGCYSEFASTYLLPVPWTPYDADVETCLTQCYNSGSPYNYSGVSFGNALGGAYCACGSALNLATGNALQLDYTPCSEPCPGNP